MELNLMSIPTQREKWNQKEVIEVFHGLKAEVEKFKCSEKMEADEIELEDKSRNHDITNEIEESSHIIEL